MFPQRGHHMMNIFMTPPLPAAGATRSAEGFRPALPSGNSLAKRASGDGWTVPVRLAAGSVSQTSRRSPWGLLPGIFLPAFQNKAGEIK